MQFFRNPVTYERPMTPVPDQVHINLIIILGLMTKISNIQTKISSIIGVNALFLKDVPVLLYQPTTSDVLKLSTGSRPSLIHE